MSNQIPLSFTVGVPLAEVKWTITRTMVGRYAGMVEGDRRGPIHHDQATAVESGYRDAIAHGTLSPGFVSAALTHALGVAWLTNSRLSAKFAGPVFPGDEIVLRAFVEERVPEGSRKRLVFEFWCENQAGDKVIVGTASSHVDS